ncbi:MAG: PLP-dependent transferase [Gemmatimonadales bacterium]|nr:PLP-dependent transferase [Gemmatimonadales bacterium]NIN50709.1 PLP-dependent transferase [Gemmatimonadales bacterium]NIP08173.1 PLP-dependent transferase [Gemmatimonadales bacterium]NIR01051.1 PLP-dependent transferase [Gemmatimonadales bacterium]NIS65130.1 PLP-dependent transferase [Gemmatimonadales bacterium]
MTKESFDGISTRAIHGTLQISPDHSPVTTPIYQSSAFVHPVGSSEEVMYTRHGNNPNQVTLGAKLAALEGAEHAIFLASGMGATALAHLAVLRPGDHLLASSWIYGGTLRLFTQEFGKLGIDVSFVAPDSQRNWRRRVRKTTRAIFVETPTDPTMRVVDLEPLATFSRERGIALIVDSTFATPVNFRPLEHGADVVIHSATKYLNGHSDIIGGFVAGSEAIVEEVRLLMQVWGQAPDPHATWLAERGLKTLAVRMERHNANGLAFATWAAQHPAVLKVHYPGLPDHQDHEIAARTLDGYGGMVGLTLAGGAAAADAALRELKLAIHAPSLGGVETLVSEPRFTSHVDMSSEERADLGMPDGYIRVSLGIEDVADIIADFEDAFAALQP